MTSLLLLTWDPVSVKPLKLILAILVVIRAIFHIDRMFVLRIDPRLLKALRALVMYKAIFVEDVIALPTPKTCDRGKF